MASQSAASMAAATSGDHESALALLEAGAGRETASLVLLSAVSAAVENNHLLVLRVLLEKGVPPGTALDTFVDEVFLAKVYTQP
jgi:hypothetical protein